ncbi:MAG: isoprenylcysteine carboxylmethyltransferase family protein [Ruminococcaceae bacterium]|nr:isoprenylcysteine carboxylmethyltransferase family protein [Oscillospiraceae bacterium]
MKLIFNALFKFLIGLTLIFALLFIPAGTLKFFGGWLFIGLLFIPIFIFGIVLIIKSPDLLRKRLDVKEKENTQKGVVAISALIFLLGFICAGLDFRFCITKMPYWLTLVASVVFLLAYGLYAEVMRENAYLSRTIKVEENQKVITSGLYAIVRHPMYTATILLFSMIPLILGSFISLIPFLFYPVLIIVRIRNEEKVLTEQLFGYDEYTKKVKYRLIPFIW